MTGTGPGDAPDIVLSNPPETGCVKILGQLRPSANPPLFPSQFQMALHPDFPSSPYEPLLPQHRWFPADEDLRETAYEKLLAPLVAHIREAVFEWRGNGYEGASPTSKSLLNHWFEQDHLLENADGTLSPFSYYFAQREAVETVIWLFEVRQARDKFDLLRFDASGAVSAGMFAEKYDDYLRLGIEEWKQSYAEHEKLGKKAVLFVMVDDTRNCDEAGAYLEKICPEMERGVLVIHTKKNREI